MQKQKIILTNLKKKGCVGMTHPRSSSSYSRSFTQTKTYPNYEIWVVLTRSTLIALNCMAIFYLWRPLGSVFTTLSMFAPFFLLCYFIISWFGPRFWGFRIANLILTLLDILITSFGLHYLPEQFFYGIITIYFTGIIINLFYGNLFSTLGLSILATIGFALAIYHSFTSSDFIFYLYKIFNFLTTNLFICILGLKITDMP